MANNPVQVIVNTSDFIEYEAPGPGGSKREYFEHSDHEFRHHRDALIAEFQYAADELDLRGDSFGIASIQLHKDALAKTSRPTGSVLRPQSAEIIGGGHAGELFARVNSSGLRVMASRAARAEETLRWEEKEGKLVSKPSAARSDVGAIRTIHLRGAKEKLHVSVAEIERNLRARTSPRSIVAKLYNFPEWESVTGDGEIVNLRDRLLLSVEEAFGEVCRVLKALPLYIEINYSAMGESSQGLDDLLSLLARSPLIESVLPAAPIISSISVDPAKRSSSAGVLTSPVENSPIVAIIDSGVSTNAFDAGWIVESRDVVHVPNSERVHGTLVAGILIEGHADNSHLPKDRSCKIYDIGIVPESDARWYAAYGDSVFAFLDQLEEEVREAAANGIQIFNISLNSPAREGEYDYYDPFAKLLDRLACELDLLFVISTGNLDGQFERSRWADGVEAKIQQIAEYRFPGQDLILNPAKSLTNLAVGAIELIGERDSEVLPAIYSRRGPGFHQSSKPDLVQHGGARPGGVHMYSSDPDGYIVPVCGTSFAAPIVAKTIAGLDHLIDGHVSRELLKAVTIHHAQVPSSFAGTKFRKLHKDFVGFGLPPSADEMLVSDDTAITLVFEGKIRRNHRLYFPFTWPVSLTESGKCRGATRLTLVSSPPIDDAFGYEMVRANVDIFLQQFSLKDSSYRSGWFDSRAAWERDLVADGYKWNSVKRWQKSSVSGKKLNSNWRLMLKCEARYDAQIPDHGIPFCAILTIADDQRTAPVYQEVLQDLRTRNAVLADIQTHVRVRSRSEG